jgi:hypothetical protein
LGAKDAKVVGDVEHWLEIVASSVHECAEHRAGRSDVFLWNARKAQEAVLYAIGQGAPDRAWEDSNGSTNFPKLAGFLKDAGKLHPEIENYLSTMRRCGNLGVHAQAPTKPVDDLTLTACNEAISASIKWLYSNSELKRSMPKPVREALRDLESAEPRIPPATKAISQIEELEKQLAAAQLVHEELGELLGNDFGPDGVNRVLMRLKRQRFWVMVCSVATIVALGALALVVFKLSEIERITRQLSSEAATVARPAAIDCTKSPTPAAESVALTATETVGSSTLNQGPNPPVPLPQPATPEVLAAAHDPVPEPLSATPVEQISPCPVGTVHVGATTLTFRRGPYERPDWPKPEPKPGKVPVHAFCLHASPVSLEAYRAWANAEAEAPPADPLDAVAFGAAGKDVANVHIWSAASRYCVAAGGMLPSIAQFEAGAVFFPAIVGDRAEWALDAFPPAVFGYVSPKVDCTTSTCSRLLHMGYLTRRYVKDLHLTWNKGINGTTTFEKVTFRCAFKPKDSD